MVVGLIDGPCCWQRKPADTVVRICAKAFALLASHLGLALLPTAL